MGILRILHTNRKVECDKPYPKKENSPLKGVLRTGELKSLEGLGDKAPRRMIAHDRIRLNAFPFFFSFLLEIKSESRRDALQRQVISNASIECSNRRCIY